MKLRTLPYLALAAAAAVVGPKAASAVVALESITYSSDITAQVGGVTFEDEAIVHQFIPFGVPTPRVPKGVPVGVDVDAFYQRANGLWLLSFDSAVIVPTIVGDLTADPGDVLSYGEDIFGGFQYSGVFFRALEGIPDGVNTDAVHETDNFLYLSFDTTVSVGGLTIDDEDVVAYDTVGRTFTMIFDGSEAGVDPDLDVDAFHRLDPPFLLSPVHYLVSFDGSGELQGIPFDDEDVMQYTPNFFIDGGGLWEIAYDSSGATFGSFAPADLDALFVVRAEGTPTPTLPPSNTPTYTSTPTHTLVPTATAPFTHTPPFSSTPTRTRTSTLPPTPPHTATSTTAPTSTATSTATLAATATITQTVTTAQTSTATPSFTATPTSVDTQISTPTETSTPTPTGEPTGTPTSTSPDDPTRTPTPTPTATHTGIAADCTGDCDGSGDVTVDEIITMVNIALGLQPVTNCPAGDAGGDGGITVDEIVAAVSNALDGCP